MNCRELNLIFECILFCNNSDFSCVLHLWQKLIFTWLWCWYVEHAWRQGSDNWSSTGSYQSSRPGSDLAHQPSTISNNSRPGSIVFTTINSRPGSNVFTQTTNCSTPDVQNFQQLSVTGRRAAFRSHKWSNVNSNSLDQTCLTTAASPGSVQRQRDRHHQPLSLGIL